jgi:hypothetical protein
MLAPEEKEKVRTILYIMDCFSISNQGYHEIAQVDISLPRTHVIEGCAKHMDSKWNVTKTHGAELSFKLLLQKEIDRHVSYHCYNLTPLYNTFFKLCAWFVYTFINLYVLQLKSGGDHKKLQVKLSGDGARMSHSSNLFVFPFAVLDIGHNILSSAVMIHVVVTFLNLCTLHIKSSK